MAAKSAWDRLASVVAVRGKQHLALVAVHEASDCWAAQQDWPAVVHLLPASFLCVLVCLCVYVLASQSVYLHFCWAAKTHLLLGQVVCQPMQPLVGY